MKKRILALLLCAVTLLSMTVLTGAAAESGSASADEPAPAAEPAPLEGPAAEAIPEQTEALAPEAEEEPQTDELAKTCTCDPQPAEGEAHKEGCPLYAAPEHPAEETKTCTCDPAPAEGEAHKEGCPLYVAPEKPADPSHIDTCSDDSTDADCKCPCHLFDKIMACTTQEALEDLIAETPEEYFGLLSDEQIQKVEAHIKSLETVPLPAVTIENDVAEETVPSEIVRPTVNYTYVAPFGDPVTGGDN